MQTGLTGTVALVCAASRGIGKAVARGLAAEGAKVAICARNQPALEAAAGGDVDLQLDQVGAGGHLGGILCAAGREPARQSRVGQRAQIVDVGDEEVAEAGRQEAWDQPAGMQGRVEVTVAGRAPFQPGVGRPLHGHARVGQELRFPAL